MGTGKQARKARAAAKKKQYKRARSTKRRAKDVDQIQAELKWGAFFGVKPLPVDDDLPGRGQFLCRYCARHFVDSSTLERHCRTKDHKKRIKTLAEKQYTQLEADMAAGMAPPDRKVEMRGLPTAGVMTASGSLGDAETPSLPPRQPHYPVEPEELAEEEIDDDAHDAIATAAAAAAAAEAAEEEMMLDI
eukprot:PLAT2739.1.p1 GENE.PLAT2739.1~~PLAT2739.1.p1  ORF type:complete len:197 (-),score=71.87 PLAT2739.1:96-665(-)